jgi:hypothetical protein
MRAEVRVGDYSDATRQRIGGTCMSYILEQEEAADLYSPETRRDVMVDKWSLTQRKLPVTDK